MKVRVPRLLWQLEHSLSLSSHAALGRRVRYFGVWRRLFEPEMDGRCGLLKVRSRDCVLLKHRDVWLGGLTDVWEAALPGVGAFHHRVFEP